MTFFTLIPAFRRMRAELETAVTGRARAESALRTCREEYEKQTAQQQEEVIRWQREALLCREKVADFMAKRAGLGTIFGPMESVPEMPRPNLEPVSSGRELAHHQAERMRHQFEKDMEAFYKTKTSV